MTRRHQRRHFIKLRYGARLDLAQHALEIVAQL